MQIVERPTQPDRDLAVTGCYTHKSRVFQIIAGLSPSPRGELEIIDVNNADITDGTAAYDIRPGWWTDSGTPASKLKASILVALAKGVTFQA